MLSPSGIDGWPVVAQAGVFMGTYGALGATTYATTSALRAVSAALPGPTWRSFVELQAPLLGATFFLLGTSHFAVSSAYTNIVPPPGTWGIWYLPGSAEFHVAWTGIAECVGGAGMLVGSALQWFDVDEPGPLRWSTPASAAALFLLTIAVTPANIYMWTHGATMPGAGPDGPLDLFFHYARFGVQVLLLSSLATVARDSFFYSWGDALD